MLNLSQKSDETFFNYCDRLLTGNKCGAYDLDNTEIWKLLFNEELSSDESRKRLYGVYKIINILKEDNLKTLNKSQLDVVREKVGELDILKRQIQVEKNDLSKVKRELIKSVAIADDLKSYFQDNFTINVPEYCQEEIHGNSDFEMILNISDWHIGYLIDDCKGNYFNWEIANLRVDKLIAECYKYIEMYGIKKIYVVNTSDTIEHVYMRKKSISVL